MSETSSDTQEVVVQEAITRDLPQELADELSFGAKRPSFNRWEPKRWELKYDMIVIGSSIGMSNTELAEKYNYGVQQISNILNCKMASKVRAKVYVALQQAAQKQIPVTLDELQVDATKRINDMLKDDELAEKAPLSVAEFALKFLATTGKISGKDGKGSVNIKAGKHSTINVMTAEAASELRRGLDRAREAETLNGASIIRQLGSGSGSNEK